MDEHWSVWNAGMQNLAHNSCLDQTTPSTFFSLFRSHFILSTVHILFVIKQWLIAQNTSNNNYSFCLIFELIFIRKMQMQSRFVCLFVGCDHQFHSSWPSFATELVLFERARMMRFTMQVGCKKSTSINLNCSFLSGRLDKKSKAYMQIHLAK